MRRLLLILLLAVLLRPLLFGQEVEQYRLYKLYEAADESEPLITAPAQDSIVVTRRVSNINLLDRQSWVVNDRRGVNYYDQAMVFNGITIPKLGYSRARRLGLHRVDIDPTPDNSFTHTQPTVESSNIALSLSTRRYLVGASASTIQLLKGGWTLSSDIDVRTGNDAHIAGTYTHSATLNITIAGKPDSLSSLLVALLFNPSERAIRKASFAQTFALTGDNYYNPAWGFDGTKPRSANTITQLLPTLITSYNREINNKHSFALTAAATIGSTARSALEWLNAATPLPDNYRYLPDYFTDSATADAVSSAWANGDSRYTQINFNELRRRNSLQPQAIYILNDRVTRTTNLQLCANIRSRISNSVELKYGIKAELDRARNFKRVTDLLSGGEFEDIDYYLIDDNSYSNSLQNNLEHTNQYIGVSDRYGYDYALTRTRAALFAQADYTTNHLRAQATVEVAASRIQRRGYFRKELFADNSLGRSRAIDFADYALHAMVEYAPNDNHAIYGQATISFTPPEAESLFLQSQYNNRTVASPTLSSLYNANIGYTFTYGKLTLQTNLFARYAGRQTEVAHLYYDAASEFADVVTTDLATVALGVEAQAQYRLARHWTFGIGVSLGRYRYGGAPTVTVYADKDNSLLAQDRVIDISQLRTGRTPALTLIGEVEYYNRGWSVSLDCQYFSGRYIAPSLLRRTESILSHAPTEQVRAELQSQQRLKDAASLNLKFSKSFYLRAFDKREYSTTAAPKFLDRHPRSRISIYLVIENLLGTNNTIYRAYESSRIRKKSLWQSYEAYPFDSYYLYAYPRTYMLQLRWSF